MAALLDEFTAIITALNEAEIKYAVCGGMAMAILGFYRATDDIDILILTEDLDKVWELAKRQGYDIKGLPLSLHQGDIEIRRISKIDPEFSELITLDLLLVTEPLQDVWRSRERHRARGLEVVTVSRDGLIKLKTIAGRTQDKADIERLNNAS